MLCDTYTQRHKTPLRRFPANYFVNKDPPYCTLRSAQVFFLDKNISSTMR